MSAEEGRVIPWKPANLERYVPPVARTQSAQKTQSTQRT
jgi:hypothetical protein